jgi:8-oxo-dGTP diphosphatase
MTVAGQDPRDVVDDLVAGVAPLDEHEAQDKATTLRWIRSGAPLFRVARPATPDKHLCVYSPCSMTRAVRSCSLTT